MCKTYSGRYRRRTKEGQVGDQGVAGKKKCGKIGDKGAWVLVHWCDCALLLTMNLATSSVQFRYPTSRLQPWSGGEEKDGAPLLLMHVWAFSVILQVSVNALSRLCADVCDQSCLQRVCVCTCALLLTQRGDGEMQQPCNCQARREECTWGLQLHDEATSKSPTWATWPI